MEDRKVLLPLFREGDSTDAYRQAIQFIERFSDDYFGYYGAAMASIRAGLIDRAVDFMRQAVIRVESDQAVLLDAGHLFQRLGLDREALECYARLLSHAPENGYVRELYSHGCVAEAIKTLTSRQLGREAAKSYGARVYSGFFRSYLSGRNILDIGYRGGYGDCEPVVPHAIGVDLSFPGYDGVHLPFPDNSQDTVYSSHCLEHIPDPSEVIRDWFRVVRPGGYVIVIVPHQYLYERKQTLPSTHPQHLHFFTPGSLLLLIEQALPPNHYRVRHLSDNDLFYDYSVPLTEHPVGSYEIELVLEKIEPPAWDLA